MTLRDDHEYWNELSRLNNELATAQRQVIKQNCELESLNRNLLQTTAELKAAKAQTEESLIRLEQSNRALEEFAYIVSHDLQAPLRKITMFGQMLQSEYSRDLGPEGQDYLERMCSAAYRMRDLITGVLAIARVNAQGQPFVDVALGEVVREVLNDLELRIQDAGARVEVGTLPVICGDALQMRQLFQNLIENALKFRRADASPVVKVNGQPEGRYCRISVEDNGVGFEPQQAERLFQPFQRLHHTAQYEGTGIGLAVCKKVVDRHGGRIMARSQPGQGATFIITLPVPQT